MIYLVKKLISPEDRLPVAMLGAGDGMHQRSVQYSFHLLDSDSYHIACIPTLSSVLVV